MDKAELIRHEIEKRRDHNLAIGNPLFSAMAEEDIELLCFIDSLQEEPVSEDSEEVEKSAPIVYVVTRCEEHSDYVEKVFFDGIKAEDYCKQFEGNENQYERDITKVEVTL